MSRTTRLIRSEALRLREQGLSLAKIANRFGVTKQYVHKLLKNGDSSTTASTRESTETVNQLTPRQRRFVKGLVEGKTHKAAALAAVEPGQITDGSAEQWAHRTLRNPKVQKAFGQILDDNGLGDEDIARVHRENLEATKVVGFTEDENGAREPFLHPDYPTRQRAVGDAWKIRGRMKAEPESPQRAQPEVLILTPEEKAMFERAFLGGKTMEEAGTPVQQLPAGAAETYIDVHAEGD